MVTVMVTGAIPRSEGNIFTALFFIGLQLSLFAKEKNADLNER